MSSFFRFLSLAWVLNISLITHGAEEKKSPEVPVKAVVDTTLTTQSGHIRQLAFDGDKDSYFASEKNLRKTDHFTLVFTKPIAVKSLVVTTGKPKGGDALESGSIEASSDGKTFKQLATFKDGQARAGQQIGKFIAIRIRANEDMKHPLVIREIAIDSEPAVAIFKYPVEFSVDVSDAPEMKEWAEKAARICEREYTMINEELKSAGFKPPRTVKMSLKSDYDGVAYASRGEITGSVKYFKAHLDDIGAMVHETTHIVQQYRTRNNPGWLVEGIADYVRFFKYEPGKIGPISARRAHYDGSYRVTAAFLQYLTTQYDKEIVLKLNKAMREGEYKDSIFKALTKKTLKELDDEWRATLKRPE